uniref:Uncharacterized protein n=1 Tax=Vespula pensylvanica TaxID=30213 RepID=A0A834P407_VESPE|nr:hypothetical protein H0235_007087 [Vespula pensylvanica]
MGYLEVAGFGVPPLRTSCDPNTKLRLRENMSYLGVAGFDVPPLRTSCDPNTKLGLREKFSRCLKFEFLTGEYDLPGGGKFRRATSFHIM